MTSLKTVSLKDAVHRLRPAPVRARPAGRAPTGDAGDGGPLDAAPAWLRAVLAGLGAAFVSAALICTLVFLAWLTSPYTVGGGAAAVQLGLSFWLLAHGVGVEAGAGPITMTPWLLTAAPFLALVWGAQWTLAAIDPAEAGPRWRWAGGLRRDVGWVALTMAGSYAVTAALAGLAARPGGVTPMLARSLLCPFLLAVVAMVPAARHQWGFDLPSLAPGAARSWRHAPLWARRALRPAGWGLAALALVGLAATVVVLALRGDRIAALYGQLNPGFFGAVVLTLAQLAYLPTLGVWMVAFLAGPGFGFGVGSSITLAQAQPGLLPLIPVLGALPEPGPMPAAAWLGLLVPVGVGALIGARAVRGLASLSSWRVKAATAAASCALAGIGVALACAMASGSLGSGRLSEVGVRPLLVGAAVTAQLALGAGLWVGGGELWLRRGWPKGLPRLRAHRQAPERGGSELG